MTAATIVLAALAGLLAFVWLLCALGAVASLRRADRALRERGLASSGPGLRDLRGIAWMASMSTVNLVWFAGALALHRLLGRPLPPPPRPWRKDPDA